MVPKKRRQVAYEYTALSTHEYDDESETDVESVEGVSRMTQLKNIAHQKQRTNSCCRFLFVLSLVGSIFLSFIGYLLQQDSIYLRVHTHHPFGRPRLSKAVYTAAILYGVCAIITYYPARRVRAVPLELTLHAIKKQVYQAGSLSSGERGSEKERQH